MAEYDGSVKINTEILTKSAQAQLRSLENRIHKTSDKIKGLKDKMDTLKDAKTPTQEYADLEKELDVANTKLQELIAKQQEFKDIGVTTMPGTFTQELDAAGDKVGEIEMKMSDLEEQGKAFTVGSDSEEFAKLSQQLQGAEDDMAVLTMRYMDFADKAKAVEQRMEEAAQKEAEAAAEAERLKEIGENAEVSDQHIVDLNNRLQELKDRQADLQSAGVGIGYAEYDQNTAQIAAAEQELREYKNSLVKTGEEEDNTGNKGVSAFSRIQSLISSVTKSAKGFLNNLAKLPGMFSKSSKSSDSMTGSLGKGVKTLLKYTLGIRSLYVLFNKMRSAATEGFENLAQYSDDTNTALSNLKSALTQLKNSLATAFSPILEYIEPALTRLINLCSSAANAFAKLVASLTGKSVYVKAAKVQENYADSIAGTGDAAEEAQKKLASFDTLETLDSNDSSSSGSGSGTDASDMFTTEEIEPISFDSWGEAFSAFLDYLLEEGIPALENALTGMADWINNFSANLYEMFTFPGVLEKVILLGQEIAEAFNNFVNLIDWSTLGGALGAGLNLALQFMVSLIYTFDWSNLGARLADAVNGAVAEIDFTAVGQWLWAKFKIGLETFAGFFNNLNMPQLVTAATNMVMGLFESIQSTIDEIDWRTIGTQITDLITNIDLGNLVEAGSNIVTGLLDSITEAINGLDWANIGIHIGEQILAVVTNIDWVGIATSIWNLLSTAFGATITIMTMAIYTLGENIISGLIQGMTESGFLADPLTWINEHIVQPFITAFCELFGINSPSTVMEEFGVYLMEGLLQGIESLVESIASIFEGIYSTIDSVWQSVLVVSTSLWTTISTTLNTLWTNLKTSVSNVFTAIKTTVSTIWTSIQTTTSSVWTSIKTSISNVLTSIKTSFTNVWNSIKTSTSNVWTGIKDTIKNAVNGVIGSINGLISGVVDGINSMIGALNSLSFDIPDWVPVLGGNTFGLNISTISAPQIPYLAKGAVIQGANPFLAVLGDQRAGQTNVETPLDTMIDAFNMALDMRGDSGSGNQTMEVNFYVEGKKFAQATLDNFIDEANRRGGIDIDLIGSTA